MANLYVFVIRFGKGHVLPLWLCKICCLLCFFNVWLGSQVSKSPVTIIQPLYCLEMRFAGYLIIGRALAISSLVHVYHFRIFSYLKQIRDPT